MTYKEKYMEAKKLLKCFIKKQYFDIFSSNDLFYLFDQSNRAILSFCEKMFNSSYGLQMFFDNEGLNYLHDVFTSKSGFSVNHFFSNTIMLAFVPKKDLTLNDYDYLKKHKINVVKEYNFVPYCFKEGYGINYLSNKEFDKVISFLYYLNSLLKNEQTDILSAFETERIVMGFFDNVEMSYEVRYTGMVNLETFPTNKKANIPFIEEHDLTSYTDDVCHIGHCYFPVKNEFDDPFPSILIAYYEKIDEYYYSFIDCKPKNITDYIFGFIDEAFLAYGIPTNVIINNRKLYANVYKTLKKMGIDVTFERENETVDENLYSFIDSKLEEIKYEFEEFDLVS